MAEWRAEPERGSAPLKAAYKEQTHNNDEHLQMKYYGEKWLKWVRKNTHTGNKSDIPERHQQKR